MKIKDLRFVVGEDGCVFVVFETVRAVHTLSAFVKCQAVRMMYDAQACSILDSWQWHCPI